MKQDCKCKLLKDLQLTDSSLIQDLKFTDIAVNGHILMKPGNVSNPQAMSIHRQQTLL